MIISNYLNFFLIPAVAIRSAGSQGVFPDKIGDTARLAHGVVKLAHGRDQLSKSQFLHKGTDSAGRKFCLVAAAIRPLKCNLLYSFPIPRYFPPCCACVSCALLWRGLCGQR